MESTDKVAISISEFCARYGISRAKAFLLLRDGAIQRVKVGRRTLVPTDSAAAWWLTMTGVVR